VIVLVGRYPLLLRELLRFTLDTHHDHLNLTKYLSSSLALALALALSLARLATHICHSALVQLETIARYVNEHKRAQENISMVLKAASSMQGAPVCVP